MKLEGAAEGHLRRGTVTELVWLAPFKSVKHMGYEKWPGIQKLALGSSAKSASF